MASETEASCIADPNFAVICSFLERFAESCGILHPNFTELQDMLENCEEVDAQLVELHVKLLRKARKSVSAEKWERALIKFGHTISAQDGWEVEKFGYIKTTLATKLRLLKGLLEAQFDLNARFKSAVNKLTASELRTSPVGRDNQGQVYWCQQDASLNVRIYKEDEDDETWTLISKDRDGLAQLISTLGGDITLADLEADEGEDELTSTNSQDDEAGDILLDTGQPEDAQPPRSDEEEEEGADNGEAKAEASNGDEKKVSVDNTDVAQTSNGIRVDNSAEPATTEPTEPTEEKKPAVNLTIPSLMSGIKRKLEVTSQQEQSKKCKSEEVSEAIEDPPVLVKGEGSGAECNDEPEFGEAIEEPLMLVSGIGAGVECDTGNPGDKEEEKPPPANDNKTTEKNEGKEGSSSETTPPKRASRWDNANISPKGKQGPSGASGMVSEWVRDGEKPEDKPEEPVASKPSVISPNKSSLWSIDQICGQSSTPPQPSIFKSGMFFGNLSKPSFSSSPERNRFLDSPKPDSNESTQSEGTKVEEKESSNGKSDSKTSNPPKQESPSKETKVDSIKEDIKTQSGPSNLKKDSSITSKIEYAKPKEAIKTSSLLKEEEAKPDIKIPSAKSSSSSSTPSTDTKPAPSKETDVPPSIGSETPNAETVKPTKQTEIKSSGATKDSKSDVKSPGKESVIMDFSKKDSAIKIPVPQSSTVSHAASAEFSKVDKVQTVGQQSKIEEVKKVSEEKVKDIQSSVAKITEKVDCAQESKDRVTLKIPEIRVSQPSTSLTRPKSPIEDTKHKMQPVFAPSKEKSPVPMEVEPTKMKVPLLMKPGSSVKIESSKPVPEQMLVDKPIDESTRPSADKKAKLAEERMEVQEPLIVKTIAPKELTVKDAPNSAENLSKTAVVKDDTLSTSISAHKDKSSPSVAHKSSSVTETPTMLTKTSIEEKTKEKIQPPVLPQAEKPKDLISTAKPVMTSTSKQPEIPTTPDVTTKNLEMDTLKPSSSSSSEKPPSPSMRLSPTSQKSGRRKSLEAISLGIMKERMKSETEISVNMASSSREVSPSKFTEEPKYVHKKFSPPEEKRGDMIVNRNISAAKSYLDKKFEMKVCNLESVPKPYDIGDKVCFSNKLSDNVERMVPGEVGKSDHQIVTDNKGETSTKIVENKVAEKTSKMTEEIQKLVGSKVISPDKCKPGSSNYDESNIKITAKVVDKPKLLIHDKKVSEKFSVKSPVLKIEEKKTETVSDKPISIKPEIKAPESLSVQPESLKIHEKPQSSKHGDGKSPAILPTKLEESKIQPNVNVVDLSKDKKPLDKAETSMTEGTKPPKSESAKLEESKIQPNVNVVDLSKDKKPVDKAETSKTEGTKPAKSESAKLEESKIQPNVNVVDLSKDKKPLDKTETSMTEGNKPAKSESAKLEESKIQPNVNVMDLSKDKKPFDKAETSKTEGTKTTSPDKAVVAKLEESKAPEKVEEKAKTLKLEDHKLPVKVADKPVENKSKTPEKAVEKPRETSVKPKTSALVVIKPENSAEKFEEKKSKTPEKGAEKPECSKSEESKSKIFDKPGDKPTDRPADKSGDKFVEKKSKTSEIVAVKPEFSKSEGSRPKIPDKPDNKPADKPTDRPAEKPADKPAVTAEKLAEKPADKPADKTTDKPVEKKSKAPEKVPVKPEPSKSEETQIPDKSTERPPEKSADNRTDKLTDRLTDKSASRSTDKPVDKQINKPTYKPADRPTDRPASKPVEKKAHESSKVEESKLKTPEKVAEKKEDTKVETLEKSEEKPKEKDIKEPEKVSEKPESSRVAVKLSEKSVSVKPQMQKALVESKEKAEDKKVEEVKEKAKSLRSGAEKTEEVKEKTEVLKPEVKKEEEIKENAKGAKSGSKKDEEKPASSKMGAEIKAKPEEDNSKLEAVVERTTRKRGAKVTEKPTVSTEEPKVSEVNDKTRKKVGLDKKKGAAKKDDSPPPDLSKEVEESPPDIVSKEHSTDTKPSKEGEMPKLEKEKSFDDSKNEEPPVLEAAEKPVTIGSALAFDYNPPPSPQSSDDDHNADNSLVIDEMEDKPSRPQRAFRGRGRPPKRGRQADVVPGAKPEETKSVAFRGRGRGRSGKARGVEVLVGRAESSTPSTDAASPDLGPVRMSRRIAQIKQKEEEERRIAEEKALSEMQMKREEELRLQALKPDSSSSEEQESSDTDSEKAENGTGKKKRKYKKKPPKDEDYIGVADEDIQSRRKKKKKRRKKKRSGKGGKNPWESSGSSDSSSNQSEELGDMVEEEEEEETVLKSDHEFSPESDLELGPGEQAEPARRARTARRDKTPKAAKEEEEEDIYKCQKCNAGDRPETILLCDTCDQGWHTSCLKPEIHLVPEGDWFCPPCAHKQLVTALTSTLKELDRSVRKLHNQELRRQRLAYVGISLDNTLPGRGDEEEDDDAEDPLQGGGSAASDDDNLREAIKRGSGESESESSSGSATSSSSEESDKYPLRQRRAAATVNYNFTEYDELIKSAIQDEVDAVKGAGNLGRGKDISTIVNAQQEEEAEEKKEEGEEGPENKEKEEKGDDDEDSDSDESDEDKKSDDEEDEERARQHAELVKMSQRKKTRSLANLDISSEDDHASDEDFHGSSEFDEDEEDGSGDSDDSIAYKRRSSGPVRRSTRARQTRYDKAFINDSEDSEDDKKKKKSGRARGWLGDSDLEESDLDSESGESDWGKKKSRKRRPAARSRAPAKRRRRSGGGGRRRRRGKGRGSRAPAKKRPAPAGSGEEGEAPTPKPKKIKPPRPTPPPSPDEPVRRATRGRKINYQEIIGSDSDDAVPKRGKGRRIISDDEDEFRPDEEEADAVVAGTSTAPQAPVLDTPALEPQATSTGIVPAPVTAAALQSMGGIMPHIVEVGRESENSDEDEEDEVGSKLPPNLVPMPAVLASLPPMPPQMATPVVTPPKTRGVGVRRGRGRGRGRPPTIPVMGRMMTKVTVSSPSQDESESDDDIPTTIGSRPIKSDQEPRVPPSIEDKVPPGYPGAQYPPQQQPPPTGGVISRLLQAPPIPPTTSQPFTAAAAASIAAKFYPNSPGNPQSYSPRAPVRYPQASPINYRPPMRLRGGPPNVGMSYPPPSMLDNEKSITPPPPAYVTRPVGPIRPGFPTQRPPFQPPPPYQTNPQAPYYNPYPVDDTGPPQFQAAYQPPDTFTNPAAQDPNAVYEPQRPEGVIVSGGAGGGEEGGEFGGLVSYFSSQREDDLET